MQSIVPLRASNSFLAWLEQNRSKTNLPDGNRNETVPGPNIKNSSEWKVVLHHGLNAVISIPQPEAVGLELHAVFVLIFRVANGRLCLRIIDAVSLLQIQSNLWNHC